MNFFFVQAEDAIQAWSVTGVQTCALPISRSPCPAVVAVRVSVSGPPVAIAAWSHPEIGRASCRERVETSVVAVSCKSKILTRAIGMRGTPRRVAGVLAAHEQRVRNVPRQY